MQTYKTESINAAIRWVGQCKGLSETSRSNLVTVLNSAQFRAALHRRDGSQIVIEYQQDLASDRLPRRVLLEAEGLCSRVAITGDRGAWILSSTGVIR
ncbi:MAG: hypothetical protein ACR2IK_18020 [Chloroflexota bacterium]